MLIFNELINAYFRMLDNLFTRLFDSHLGNSVVAELRLRSSGTIDERLSKIDAARQNLLESLEALDDLKSEADQNKKSLQSALETIAEIEQKKTAAQNELDSLRQVANLDASALKKLFDVPTPGRIWRERFYGLLTGIIASLIAAFVWQLVT